MISYATDRAVPVATQDTQAILKEPVRAFGKRDRPALSNWYGFEFRKDGTAKAVFLPDRREGFLILNKKEADFIKEIDGNTYYTDIGEKLGLSKEETEKIHEQLLDARIIREGRYVKELHSFTVVGAKEYGKAFRICIPR